MITFTFSHEIKRHLLLGREVMMNPDSVLKSRDITLPTKVCLVKAMVFPVVMYGGNSLTIKKAKCHVFELWCWRRLLRVLWTARRSNQFSSVQLSRSVVFNQFTLKDISPEYSLEGLMLKLKLQYFGHLMHRADSLEKTLMLRKIESKRSRRQRKRGLGSITDSVDMALCKLWETVKVRGARRTTVRGGYRESGTT